jgi:hypothetical protein
MGILEDAGDIFTRYFSPSHPYLREFKVSFHFRWAEITSKISPD